MSGRALIPSLASGRVWLAAAVTLAALSACRERHPPAPAAKGIGVHPGKPRAAHKRDAGPPDPRAAEGQAIQQKVAAVLQCFHSDMLGRQKDPNLAAYRRNTFTDLFVFHALFDDPSRIQQDPAALCTSIGERYRAAFVAAATKRASTGHPATVSSLPVDAEPAFVAATNNPTGLHILEHAEVTRGALLEAAGGRRTPIVELAARASQQPDIHRWDDVRYHALTAAAPKPGSGDRANSEEAFVGLVSYQLVNFVLGVRGGADARAALFLGIACHMAQDLAWNRGLTRTELAGLQFVRRRDPHRATNTAGRREAMQASRRILQIARESLADPVRWSRFLTAKPGALDFESSIQRVLVQDGSATPLGLGQLTGDWIAQLPYQRSAAARRDLQAAPRGQDLWQIEPLFERIARSVQNSGLALRSGDDAKKLPPPRRAETTP